MEFPQKDLHLAIDLLRSAKRILIIAHQKPDGDTGGSSLALWHWLTGEQKEVTIFCKDDWSSHFSFLPNADVFTKDPSIFQESWDLMLVCDSGDLRYAGVADFVEGMKEQPKIINFDHHASNKLFGEINFVDVHASSTAEVLFSFFTSTEIDLTPEMAKCLLTAVFTDTHGFSNAATNEHALKMASQFVQQGASIPEIYQATIGNKKVDEMKLWGRVFSRLRYGKHNIAYTYILKNDFLEMGVPETAIEGMSNYLSAIGNARAIMVFTEKEEGLLKASLRTLHDDVDLTEFAAFFSGGGHKKASGFTITGRLVETESGLQII